MASRRTSLVKVNEVLNHVYIKMSHWYFHPLDSLLSITLSTANQDGFVRCTQSGKGAMWDGSRTSLPSTARVVMNMPVSFTQHQFMIVAIVSSIDGSDLVSSKASTTQAVCIESEIWSGIYIRGIEECRWCKREHSPCVRRLESRATTSD